MCARCRKRRCEPGTRAHQICATCIRVCPRLAHTNASAHDASRGSHGAAIARAGAALAGGRTEAGAKCNIGVLAGHLVFLAKVAR